MMTIPPPHDQAAIALGCNLGHCQATLDAALVTLNHLPWVEVLARSHWYRTKAVGPPQPDYWNGCALLRVKLSPGALMDQLLAIEEQFGRVRQERWGPRTLDLDLLLFGDWVMKTPHLELPHPRLRERAFVLIPLMELVPHWREPTSGRAIADLAQDLDTRGVERLP